jgi:DNA-directed RNA polymerase subunit RPC12/RpoP
MSEAMARPVLAGNIVEVKAGNKAEVDSANERVHCDECGSDEVYRIFRKGYFQEKIYPLFGFYPWRCKRCGLRLMLHKRDMASEQDSTE